METICCLSWESEEAKVRRRTREGERKSGDALQWSAGGRSWIRGGVVESITTAPPLSNAQWSDHPKQD